MKYWISSLINIKANNINEAFLDLADLTDKHTDLLSDNEKSKRYFLAGEICIDLEDYQRAIVNYTKAIELDSKFAFAFYSRGIVYETLNEYQRAIGDYSKAIELDPKNASAYNNLGYVLMKKGQFLSAKENLEKSKDLKPENSWVHRNFACYYALQGQEELALQNLEKAILYGYNDVEWLKEESSLASIQEHPRFVELLNSVAE